MDADRTKKNVVEETTIQLRQALESGDKLRRVVSNAENAMVEFDSNRATVTGELIKMGLEHQPNLPEAYKLRLRAEVLLNAYQDWSAEIAVQEAVPSK